jgi:peptide/nickel transport system ATP-binding protein
VLLDVADLSVDIKTDDGILRAVQSVSFNVDRGETLCIVGESGCGKSLTALALIGLLPERSKSTALRLAFDGGDLTKLSYSEFRRIRGRRIAMIFQEPMTSLNPLFTVARQLVDVHREHHRSTEQEARNRAVFLLNKVGVTNAEQRLSQFPHQLSGGLRQRVMIAMALMCGPDLMIADEPTTALDVTIQAELLRLIVDLQHEFGMGMIFITHDLGIVRRIATKVAVMYAGQIVEYGDADDIFKRARHPYTRGLLRCLPSGRTSRTKHLPVIPGQVPALTDDLRGCHFRKRCAFAVDSCEKDIQLCSSDGSHLYRCIASQADLEHSNAPCEAS